MGMPTDFSQIPQSIDWFTNADQLNILKVRQSQLSRDKKVLTDLGLATFDRFGCSRDTFEILFELRRLTKLKGRKPAIQEVNKLFGSKNDGN